MARVLIVDNEAPVRVMLAAVLRASGYNVSAARSGFEAIEIASALVPDLVMLDVNLPGFDGWATIDQMLADRPSTKVLMMSGSDYATEALAHGAIAFLAKPYRPSDVLNEVARALEGDSDHPTLHAA